MTGSNYRPRGGESVGLDVSPEDFIQERIGASFSENLTISEASGKWWS